MPGAADRTDAGGRRGVVVPLLMSCHPLPAAAMTVALTVAAALTGRRPAECVLVAGTTFTGQLTIGWTNDVVDAERDRRTGRQDKPVALGTVSRRTVLLATGAMTAVVVPLSLANGRRSGLAHLGLVLNGWLYNLLLKQTALSFVPYAVGFGMLPAFLSYGGWGPGAHGSPPTRSMTALAAVLGVGIHVLNATPDIAEDTETGVRHLPLRIAARVGAPRLFRAAVAGTGITAAAMAVVGATVGVRRPTGRDD
jgi:4-hydroxybenzoate polyprenyltransferase